MPFSSFDFLRFGIAIDFLQNQIDFFGFQINDVVHDTLRKLHMFGKQFEIEISIFFERIHHIRVKIDGEQTTTVVGDTTEFRRRGLSKQS